MKKLILNQTNHGLDVFYFYMPCDFTPKKNFRNPFYNDRRASCNIYFDAKNKLYRMKDFGNEDFSGDCFWFVAMVKGLDMKRDFVLILQTIISDLNLQIEVAKQVSSAKKIVQNSNMVSIKDVPENSKSFSVLERELREDDINYWGHFGISKRVLETFNVKAIVHYEAISSQGKKFTISETREEPIYAYKKDAYIKLYRPKSKTRFLYGGNTEEDYVFGIEQLPNKGDLIFITGGEKDVLSLSAHGFNAICFNSETANISETILEMLDRRFKHIILLYDMDETGIRASLKIVEQNTKYSLLRLELPLKGSKDEKDISDFFALGFSSLSLKELIAEELRKLYTQTMFLLCSCEINYNKPPNISKSIISVNDVPIGTQGNLFCITGGEGTGKSNYVSAILSGAIQEDEALSMEVTLGLEVNYNPLQKAVLHYDTEQSEAQLYKNLGKTLRRAKLDEVPDFYHSLYLASLSRKERLKIIRESMDLYHHKHGGIHIVVIDGIADLIRSANDETESIAIVDELYRLAGIYNTCIICVLHFVPSGLKLRGHIGSELQRKAAGILSIENDDTPSFSVVKALKVRDGSPLDIPMMLFAWDKQEAMHVYKGVKSKEDKEKRKKEDLISIVKEIFRQDRALSYLALCDKLMTELDVKERTAKKYIAYMKKEKILCQDNKGNYKKEN